MFFLVLVLSLTVGDLFSGTPPHGFEMGKPTKQWEADGLKDISNPQSWEETRFEYGKPVTLFGIEANKAELAFWNKRLYEVKITLPMEAWDEVKKNLDKEYGQPWIIDTTVTEKSGQWGETKNGVAVYQISSFGTIVTFTDEAQKDFHFGDLFHGILLWIIVTIVGLFVLNWFIAWLLTSYCKRCKTFNMKLAGRDVDNFKDYNTEILGNANYHHDTTYKYKCSRCGHTRKDKYSGFWSYVRSKD
ncbi:MAG: hypothetical protein Q8M29_01705 [Bacteroidota bacterium]|nr:hypothetical protein [Bacteroidota bacterium]